MKLWKAFFPYVLTLGLWYLTSPILNPFGILAMIPVFYCTFCAKIRGFFPFGFLICFLLDFNAGTMFLFCSAFLLFYAANSAFGITDAGFGMRPFAIFAALLSSLLFFHEIYDSRFWVITVWLVLIYCWLCMMYMPLAVLLRSADK
jgi:hypothetical protein